MKLNPIAENQNEVEIGKITVLFSYKTPVAVMRPIPVVDGQTYTYKVFITDKKWSVTTSRHINKWLRERWCFTEDMIKNVATMPQAELDELCA